MSILGETGYFIYIYINVKESFLSWVNGELRNNISKFFKSKTTYAQMARIECYTS